MKNSNAPLKYYNTVPRYSQIHHARMLMESSDLNDHLVEGFIKEDPSCECGAQTENPTHYLLFCPKYSGQRKKLTDKLEVLDLPPESNLSNILLKVILNYQKLKIKPYLKQFQCLLFQQNASVNNI